MFKQHQTNLMNVCHPESDYIPLHFDKGYLFDQLMTGIIENCKITSRR
jgi:hypothetical protein